MTTSRSTTAAPEVPELPDLQTKFDMRQIMALVLASEAGSMPLPQTLTLYHKGQGLYFCAVKDCGTDGQDDKMANIGRLVMCVPHARQIVQELNRNWRKLVGKDPVEYHILDKSISAAADNAEKFPDTARRKRADLKNEHRRLEAGLHRMDKFQREQEAAARRQEEERRRQEEERQAREEAERARVEALATFGNKSAAELDALVADMAGLAELGLMDQTAFQTRRDLINEARVGPELRALEAELAALTREVQQLPPATARLVNTSAAELQELKDKAARLRAENVLDQSAYDLAVRAIDGVALLRRRSELQERIATLRTSLPATLPEIAPEPQPPAPQPSLPKEPPLPRPDLDAILHPRPAPEPETNGLQTAREAFERLLREFLDLSQRKRTYQQTMRDRAHQLGLELPDVRKPSEELKSDPVLADAFAQAKQLGRQQQPLWKKMQELADKHDGLVMPSRHDSVVGPTGKLACTECGRQVSQLYSETIKGKPYTVCGRCKRRLKNTATREKRDSGRVERQIRDRKLRESMAGASGGGGGKKGKNKQKK